MRVLLVNPPVGFSYGVLGIMRPPLGLAYIASVLKDHHEVEIVDFNASKLGWKDYRYGDFDVVGISADTSRYNTAVDIARLAKGQGSLVTMGGLHVSFMDREALETGVVDYVVRHEGEYSFLSLVDFLSGRCSFDDVRGVSYLDNGEYAKTPDAELICDLDSLPFPARELLPMERYKERMDGRLMSTIVTSRGCPFDCDFCSSSQFFGRRWRARSAQNVVDEAELLYTGYGYRAISFVDDNFTLDPRRAIEISEMITAKGWDLIWAAMSRVDTIVKNPDMVSSMVKAGFRWSFIGFESGSQEALDGYAKKASLRDAVEAMEILREHGVQVTGAFILGALNETSDMMKQTIRFAKRLNPRRAQFSILTPYPGTNLYETVKHRLLTGDWGLYSGLHPTIDLEHVSPGELRRLHVLAYASFYGRPRKAIENLSYIARTLPIVTKYLAQSVATTSAGFISRPVIRAAKSFGSICR